MSVNATSFFVYSKNAENLVSGGVRSMPDTMVYRPLPRNRSCIFLDHTEQFVELSD